MSRNIRIAVPCTDLTKRILLTEYSHQKKDRDTLFQRELNVDIFSFTARRETNGHPKRTEIIKIFLNEIHSKLYKPEQTEIRFANAIEKKARELLIVRIMGAYETSSNLHDSINYTLDNLDVTGEGQLQNVRKAVYRYRQSRGLL